MEKVSDTSPRRTPAQRLIGDVAPKLVELTDNVPFGDVWARPDRSPRDRSPVTVSGRDNGVTQAELIETINILTRDLANAASRRTIENPDHV